VRKIPLERGDKVGPGSIKYCMPEDCARELGRRSVTQDSDIELRPVQSPTVVLAESSV
jgi:hypothetical protein